MRLARRRNLPCLVPHFHLLFILSWTLLEEGVLTFLWREEELLNKNIAEPSGQKAWHYVWVQPFTYWASFFTSEYSVPHRWSGTLICILVASLSIDILKNASQHLECYIFVRYGYDMKFRKKKSLVITGYMSLGIVAVLFEFACLLVYLEKFLFIISFRWTEECNSYPLHPPNPILNSSRFTCTTLLK